jgi:hypothetical protein
MYVDIGGGIMNAEEQQTDHRDINLIKSNISNLFNQCLDDIEKTVSVAGLTMKDVGIDMGKYTLYGGTCSVELKLQL